MSCEHLVMSYSTFSKTQNDALKEPMFFGQPVNVARYDQQKYEVFEKLIEKQLSFFWRPEEIDVSRDRIDYANLPEHEKHIFISNLKYQTLLDSVQGRSPNVAFLPLVSIPELETWIETWSFSETIHSRRTNISAPAPKTLPVADQINPRQQSFHEANAQRPADRLQIRRQNPVLPQHPRRRGRYAD